MYILYILDWFLLVMCMNLVRKVGIDCFIGEGICFVNIFVVKS